MSATTITIIIILIILGSIAILFISQAREKARIEKVRKVNSLQDRYRRIQRLFNEIPPQYLNKELRVMILQRGLETLNELTPYKVDPNIDTKIAKDTQLLKEVSESTEKPKPVAIKDEESAKEVSKLLELLYRFIERQRATKKLDPKSSKKYLLYITFLMAKAKADLFADRAKKCQTDGKLRVAIHNYHSAVAELTPLKENPLAIKSINNYRAKIKQLEAAASQEKEKSPEVQEAEKQELNKEWDSYLDTDDKWKKKSHYDD